MLRLKLNHVSKRGHWLHLSTHYSSLFRGLVLLTCTIHSNAWCIIITQKGNCDVNHQWQANSLFMMALSGDLPRCSRQYRGFIKCSTLGQDGDLNYSPAAIGVHICCMYDILHIHTSLFVWYIYIYISISGYFIVTIVNNKRSSLSN